jgi:ubiquinone biosynthesis protein UbiJ
LLESESWARERLRPFAGSHVRIVAGPVGLLLCIDQRGMLVAGEKVEVADVTVTLPSDTPVRFLLDRDGLFAAAKLSGSADIAESLAFVFRNLRWDVEADLARVLGDIPARRLALLGAQLGRQTQVGAKNIAQNLVEYATEDSPLLAANRDVEGFAKAVDHLRDDLARLEKRICRLAI